MEDEKIPKPQQLDAMIATIQNVLKIPDADQRKELILATIETLEANEARGEITAATKSLMLRILEQGNSPPGRGR